MRERFSILSEFSRKIVITNFQLIFSLKICIFRDFQFENFRTRVLGAPAIIKTGDFWVLVKSGAPLARFFETSAPKLKTRPRRARQFENLKTVIATRVEGAPDIIKIRDFWVLVKSGAPLARFLKRVLQN